MKRAGAWLLTVVLGAVVVHLLTLWLAPRLIMERTMSTLAGASGSNVLIHPPRADAASRAVVRPSPDLLYSICVLDLGDGPVRVRAPASEPYASLSVFAANTDNVFVVNDRALEGGWFDILLSTDPGTVPPAGATLVRLPSAKGIALLRRVITDDEQHDAIDTTRRAGSCAPLPR